MRPFSRNEDSIAADNFVRTFASGDTASWRGHTRAQWVVGGNIHLVATPEQIVAWFGNLYEAGCDGVQVNFFDYLRQVDDKQMTSITGDCPCGGVRYTILGKPIRGGLCHC